MTVYANKPEINIREKLKELDYGHVPYEKMPAGSVIQTSYVEFLSSGTANESETSSTSWQPTLFEVTINPTSTNSLFKIESAPNVKANGGSGYHAIGVFRKIGDGDWVNAGNPNDVNNWGQMTVRYAAESTWWGIVPILMYDSPNTLEPVTYKLYHKNSAGSYVVRVGENGADEYMSVQEIKQ
jgi:hypothetical protein